MPNTLKGLAKLRGNEPTFHDPALDAALNDYIILYVDRLEGIIGESRNTLALLENMKEFLVDAVKKASIDALNFTRLQQTLQKSKWTVRGQPASRADAARALASSDEEDDAGNLRAGLPSDEYFDGSSGI